MPLTAQTVRRCGDRSTSAFTRGIAYDSGRVFAVNRTGLLRGFDATTGTQLWSRQLVGQSFTSPPTAMGGTVYVSGFTTLYAVSAQDGTVKWSAPNVGRGSEFTGGNNDRSLCVLRMQ